MKERKSKNTFYFCFSRWANKPYAAFCSLKKVVKIGVLCVAYSMIVAGGNQLNAQTERATVLDEATILAERQRAFSEGARIVTVIDKAEIMKAPVNSLNGLLNMVAGLDVRSRGQNGVQADISIRGGTFDQVMILLNGVNITDPQTGHLSANIPVNLDDIDRIEILKGAGIRTLGPGAFSGAINIVTGEQTDKKLHLAVWAGQHSFLSQTVSANIRQKRVGLYASAFHSQSEGYMQATDFNSTNFYLQTQYISPVWGALHLQAGYQYKAFGSNSFYSAAFLNQFEYTRTMFGALKWSKSIDKVEFTLAAYWRRLYDRYELIRDSSYGRNFHRSNMPGVQARLSYIGVLGTSTLGGGYRTEGIISTVIGTPLNRYRNVHLVNDLLNKPQYSRGSSRNSLYYFLDQSIHVNKLTLSGGVQGLWNSVYDNHFYGGMDAGYHFSTKLKVVGGVNTSLRLPTFTELYYKTPGYMSNDSLKPEHATTYELGVQYRENKLAGSFSLFQRRGTSIIDWVKTNAADPWRSTNLASVNASGVEGDLVYTLPNSLIRRVQVGFFWQTQEKNEANYISKYVLDYLRVKAVLSLDHRIINWLSANWQFNLHDRAGSYTDFASGKEVAYPVLLLTDLRINYNASSFVVFAVFNNLFDTKYVDIANVKQPGLWIKTGIQVML